MKRAYHITMEYPDFGNRYPRKESRVIEASDIGIAVNKMVKLIRRTYSRNYQNDPSRKLREVNGGQFRFDVMVGNKVLDIPDSKEDP